VANDEITQGSKIDVLVVTLAEDSNLSFSTGDQKFTNSHPLIGP
jgi:hypothetical protein